MKRTILFLLAMAAIVALVGPNSDRSDAAEVGPGIIANGPSARLSNWMTITPEIYCGGEPHDQEAFAQLAALGVKTVVSVDGARPDIEEAHKQGLRYVHIPIGYDGIGESARLSLARLVRDVQGPIYFHCHHGRHRGPAATAMACMAAGVMDQQEALALLDRAGTSKDYAGLWRAVANYRMPPDGAELPELVEVAEVESLAAAMAEIHRAFSNLRSCREADWQTPADHPDLIPAQQALLLKEGLRESARNLSEAYGQPLRAELSNAEQLAQQLVDALSANDPPQATQQYQLIEQSCLRCHARHRN